MEYILWMLLIPGSLLVHAQSGDDETVGIFCSSSLSLNMSNLTCYMDEEDMDDIENVTLCSDFEPKCYNETFVQEGFSFHGLTVLEPYKLKVFFKGVAKEERLLDLRKIVHLPAPEVENVTFKDDEALVHIRFHHDYVKPLFQVEMWGESDRDKKVTQNITYKQLSIAGEMLKNRETYYVRVRALPVDYFGGSWSNWSPAKTFTVSKEWSFSVYIFLWLVPFLVVVIGLLIIHWKKEIKKYLSPNIPHPKTTLALIHQEKEHAPVSFSPEIFNDVKINTLDYAEEKQLPSDDDGDQDEVTRSLNGSALLCDEQDDDQRLGEEMCHLKIRLPPEPEPNNNGSQNVAVLQRNVRDETYVSMSSLYKTQSG